MLSGQHAIVSHLVALSAEALVKRGRNSVICNLLNPLRLWVETDRVGSSLLMMRRLFLPFRRNSVWRGEPWLSRVKIDPRCRFQGHRFFSVIGWSCAWGDRDWTSRRRAMYNLLSREALVFSTCWDDTWAVFPYYVLRNQFTLFLLWCWSAHKNCIARPSWRIVMHFFPSALQFFRINEAWKGYLSCLRLDLMSLKLTCNMWSHMVWFVCCKSVVLSTECIYHAAASARILRWGLFRLYLRFMRLQALQLSRFVAWTFLASPAFWRSDTQSSRVVLFDGQLTPVFIRTVLLSSRPKKVRTVAILLQKHLWLLSICELRVLVFLHGFLKFLVTY